MEKPSLLHIGYPKSMSTTLQRCVFARHPEILFLGWGTEDLEHGWRDDRLAALCEVGIRYQKVLDYDPRKAAEVIAPYQAQCSMDDSKRILCLSSESFCFTMNHDVDATIKADRLMNLLGDNIKVLIVVREQLSLIRSYYYECIRGGYTGYFEEFLDQIYHYQFHSIISDLRYHQIYKLYCNLVGSENVLVVAMEEILDNNDNAVGEICRFAGLTEMKLPLENFNSSNDLKFLNATRLLNEKFPHNQGATRFSWAYPEKLRTYWSCDLGVPEPPAAKATYGTSMMILRAAQSVISDFVLDLEAGCSIEWQERVLALYRHENSALAAATGIDLNRWGYAVEG